MERTIYWQICLLQELERLQEVYQSYRQQIEEINKIVHPFDEQNNWMTISAIEKGLINCLRSITTIAEQVGIEIAVDKAEKILAQISPIAQGIENWIAFTKTDLDRVNLQLYAQLKPFKGVTLEERVSIIKTNVTTRDWVNDYNIVALDATDPDSYINPDSENRIYLNASPDSRELILISQTA